MDKITAAWFDATQVDVISVAPELEGWLSHDQLARL